MSKTNVLLAYPGFTPTPEEIVNSCTDPGIAESTALRWIRAMAGVGQLLRKPDTKDWRRVFVILAPKLLEAITIYLRELRELAPVTRKLWPKD